MRVLSRIPLHPVLFAAYAVLFLYAANLALVLPVDVVPPLVRSVIGAAIAWAVLTVLFRDPRRAAVIAFFAFGHVAPGLTDRGLDDRAQVAVWAVIVVAAVAYAIRAKGSLPT